MKALRTAAIIVDAAALVATGIGAAGTAGLLGAAVANGGAIAGIASASAFTAIGAVAGVAASVLSLAAGAAVPKGSLGGTAAKFTIDKDTGIPIIIGRTTGDGRLVPRAGAP